MVSSSEAPRLRKDELAFYFAGGAGVGANDLGVFLQRAATIARREGAELVVTGLEPGSLTVKMKALAASAAKEFNDSPVRTTGAGVGMVAVVASAIVWAMSSDAGEATPIAKAGAEIVTDCGVDNIQVITINRTEIVMDQPRAWRIKEVDAARKRKREPADVRGMLTSARRGELTGSVTDVDGELHFRPDGFRYLVPIDLRRSDAAEDIYPQAHFRIRGEITTERGQPDSIIVATAERI